MSRLFAKNEAQEFEPEVSIEDIRPVICECDICGREICRALDGVAGDDYYLLNDGTSICRGDLRCLKAWADKHFLQRG